ncbi:MAG: hypothetical protein ACOYI5_01640 [Christensenellales bacterium]|jgi:hypothetical protein
MGESARQSAAKEANRRERLRALEDKRLAFAQRMRAEGFDPELTLYIQREGGFHAIAQNGGEICILYGPGPNEDADFTCERYEKGQLRAELRPAAQASTGMGGAFGIGAKGGVGFALTITRPDDTVLELTLLSDIGAYLEVERRKNALLSPRRTRGDANFVWNLTSGSPRAVRRIGETWLRILTN